MRSDFCEAAGLKVGEGFRMQGAPGMMGRTSLTRNVVGVVTTGDATDNEMLLPLQAAQSNGRSK